MYDEVDDEDDEQVPWLVGIAVLGIVVLFWLGVLKLGGMVFAQC